MKSFKYPNVSAGYIGRKYVNSSNNSAYFSYLLQDLSLLDSNLCFPQRIPKIGYFEEIAYLENITNYDFLIKNIISKIKYEYKSILNNKEFLNSNPIRLINLLRLMLRFSLFEEILKTNEIIGMDKTVLHEIKYLKEIATIENNISNHTTFTLSGLKKIIEIENLPLKLKLYTANRIIVYHYRNKASIDKLFLENLIKTHLHDIQNYNLDDFSPKILKSTCYRGLAMCHDIGKAKQQEMLDLAESYARNTKYRNEIEKLIFIDNLNTCLQTLAKWNIHNNKPEEAKLNLNEICLNDPFDSVGHSEMGLLLFQQGLFNLAYNYFQSAANLGPPGVGMNLYFKGKCLEKLSKTNEAIEAFYASFEADKRAISPLLDLFNIYKVNNPVEMKKIALIIFSSPILLDQCDTHEIKELKTTISRE